VPPLRFLLAHTQGFLIGCLGLRRLSETPVQVGLRGVEPLFLVAFPDQASGLAPRVVPWVGRLLWDRFTC